MSISSEITRIRTEVTSQTDLITLISSALKLKMSGGSGSDIFGDNLADPTEMILNKYINGATESGYSGWSITGYIPVEPGKLYSVTPFDVVGIGNIQYTGFYDENKQYLKRVENSDFATSDKITLLSPPENAKYVRFSSTTSIIESVGLYEYVGKSEENYL